MLQSWKWKGVWVSAEPPPCRRSVCNELLKKPLLWKWPDQCWAWHPLQNHSHFRTSLMYVHRICPFLSGFASLEPDNRSSFMSINNDSIHHSRDLRDFCHRKRLSECKSEHKWLYVYTNPQDLKHHPWWGSTAASNCFLPSTSVALPPLNMILSGTIWSGLLHWEVRNVRSYY